MTAPTSYTEDGLRTYMHSIIAHDDTCSELASSMAWAVASSAYDEAINEALLVYGTADITTISGIGNIRQLRAIARMELWRLVAGRTVDKYQTSEGAVSISKNQIHEHAVVMLDMAESEAAALDVDIDRRYRVGQTAVIHTADSYRYGLSTDNEWSRVN